MFLRFSLKDGFQERKNHIVMVLSFLVTVVNMVITSFQGKPLFFELTSWELFKKLH